MTKILRFPYQEAKPMAFKNQEETPSGKVLFSEFYNPEEEYHPLQRIPTPYPTDGPRNDINIASELNNLEEEFPSISSKPVPKAAFAHIYAEDHSRELSTRNSGPRRSTSDFKTGLKRSGSQTSLHSIRRAGTPIPKTKNSADSKAKQEQQSQAQWDSIDVLYDVSKALITCIFYILSQIPYKEIEYLLNYIIPSSIVNIPYDKAIPGTFIDEGRTEILIQELMKSQARFATNMKAGSESIWKLFGAVLENFPYKELHKLRRKELEDTFWNLCECFHYVESTLFEDCETFDACEISFVYLRWAKGISSCYDVLVRNVPEFAKLYDMPKGGLKNKRTDSYYSLKAFLEMIIAYPSQIRNHLIAIRDSIDETYVPAELPLAIIEVGKLVKTCSKVDYFVSGDPSVLVFDWQSISTYTSALNYQESPQSTFRRRSSFSSINSAVLIPSVMSVETDVSDFTTTPLRSSLHRGRSRSISSFTSDRVLGTSNPYSYKPSAEEYLQLRDSFKLTRKGSHTYSISSSRGQPQLRRSSLRSTRSRSSSRYPEDSYDELHYDNQNSLSSMLDRNTRKASQGTTYTQHTLIGEPYSVNELWNCQPESYWNFDAGNKGTTTNPQQSNIVVNGVSCSCTIWGEFEGIRKRYAIVANWNAVYVSGDREMWRKILHFNATTVQMKLLGNILVLQTDKNLTLYSVQQLIDRYHGVPKINACHISKKAGFFSTGVFNGKQVVIFGKKKFSFKGSNGTKFRVLHPIYSQEKRSWDVRRLQEFSMPTECCGIHSWQDDYTVYTKHQFYNHGKVFNFYPIQIPYKPDSVNLKILEHKAKPLGDFKLHNKNNEYLFVYDSYAVFVHDRSKICSDKYIPFESKLKSVIQRDGFFLFISTDKINVGIVSSSSRQTFKKVQVIEKRYITVLDEEQLIFRSGKEIFQLKLNYDKSYV